MTGRACTLLAIALAACGRASAVSDDPEAQPPEPTRLDRPAMVRFHMRQHFGDLREVERLLVAGKLTEGKTRAFLLTKPATDPGMARWQPDLDALGAAARALTEAPGLDEALRREARVAETCARCHARTRTQPVFATAAPEPADEPTAVARMARHQWAVDRLWEGMVGPSEAPWRAGLDALATTPLPFSPATDAPLLSSRLQTLAREALAHRTSDELSDRARAYGEILVTCSACHSVLERAPVAGARR